MKPNDKRIIIFSEKHGDRYFSAKTIEDIGAVCLKVARERIKDGYWYDTTPYYGKSPEVTQEEIDALPDGALKNRLQKEIELYNDRKNREDRKFDRLRKLVSAVKEGDEKAARMLIDERKDYEYEGYEIVYLEETAQPIKQITESES